MYRRQVASVLARHALARTRGVQRVREAAQQLGPCRALVGGATESAERLRATHERGLDELAAWVIGEAAIEARERLASVARQQQPSERDAAHRVFARAGEAPRDLAV